VLPPGAALTIVLQDAAFDGSGSMVVRRLGCERRQVEKVVLPHDGAWTLDLRAGAYQLDVFTRFQAADGRSGDVIATVGVLVDPEAKPRIEPAPAARSGC
jgi:hypothetical protein